MELGPGEVVEPGPAGLAGHVEKADPAHEHMTLGAGPVTAAEHPNVAVVFPGRRLDGDAESEVRPEPELVDRVLEIFLQLGLPGSPDAPRRAK